MFLLGSKFQSDNNEMNITTEKWGETKSLPGNGFENKVIWKLKNNMNQTFWLSDNKLFTPSNFLNLDVVNQIF